MRYLRDRAGVTHERAKYFSDQHPMVFGIYALGGEAIVTCLDCIALDLPEKMPWVVGATRA